MEDEAEPNRRPKRSTKVPFIGAEGKRARLAGFVDCETGRKQHVAHESAQGS